MRFITQNHEHDGVDRRGFLKCMAWAGTGALCVINGGVLKSYSLSEMGKQGARVPTGDLGFVQISDSHIGFNKAANPDVVATLEVAIARINALPTPPSFVIHTGDLTQLSKPDEFDTLGQVLKAKLDMTLRRWPNPAHTERQAEIVQEGRDFFNQAPKPEYYKPYTYPHPLQGGRDAR